MNHDAETYERFRPLYPEALFRPFWSALPQGQKTELLDVACGTGQSTFSLSASAPRGMTLELHACDSDPEMIKRLTHLTADALLSLQPRVASAEALPFPNQSFDGVICLSAYHWFDRELANSEILRVLKPGGIILVGEYQFPKCPALPELNEWIRRQFNLHWKLDDQKPRGTLRSLLTPLVQNPRIQSPLWQRHTESLMLKPEAFLGLLQSQARFLASIARIRESNERVETLQKTFSTLNAFMEGQPHEFEFKYQMVLLQTR